jgi:predicted RNase H-like HicB family nuclease
MKFRIEIEVLENGYAVEIPDIKAYNKADADYKKAKKGSSGPSCCSPYMGDFMKSYAAKTVDEVLALVKPALKNLPQSTFDEAFAEAAKMSK